MLVKKDLIVLKEGNPVKVFKYTDFEDPAKTVKTSLGNLPGSDHLDSFSICNMANSLVIVSGGSASSTKSTKVLALDTSTWTWQAQPLPDLNIARSAHSSTCLSDSVYIACGRGNNFDKLNSVEILNMSVGGAAESQAWSLVYIDELRARDYPAMSQIGLYEICILGGQNS